MFSAKKANNFLLILMILLFIVSFSMEPIVYWLQNRYGIQPNVVVQVIMSQWVFIFIPTLLYFIIKRVKIRKSLLFGKIDIVNLLLVLALSFTIQPIMSIINIISQFFVKNEIGQVLMYLVDRPYWLLLLLIAVTPAIVEEFLMRGLILSNYRNYKLWTVCLINGLFFGVFHMNVNQFLYAFFLGIVFTFVLHITESIFSTMIMHFIINASSVTLLKSLYWMSDLLEEFSPGFKDSINSSMNATPSPKDLALSLVIFIPIALVAGVLSTLILWGLLKRTNKLHIIKENPLSRDIFNLPATDYNRDEKSYLTPSFYGIIAIFMIIVLNNEVGLHFIEKIITLF